MKMRKSISKIMALLLAVTVMASMMAIPAMASGTEKPQYTSAYSFGDYTSAQFNADLSAASNYAFFDFEGETKSSDWETQAVSFSEDIKGTDANLTLDWSGTNGKSWLYVHEDEPISDIKSIWINKNETSTITINNTEDLKATAIGWLSRPRGTSGRGTTITVNYSDGTSKAFPQYTLPGDGVSFLGFKAEQGTYITSISFSAASAILYYDDICVIMEGEEEVPARDYFAPDKMTGGSKTTYTMEQFVSALDEAEYKVVENFDDTTIMTTGDNAFVNTADWLQKNAYITHPITNSSEKLSLFWKNNNNKQFKWLEAGENESKVVSGGYYMASNYSSNVTDGDKTTLNLVANGDLKPVELGYAVSATNANRTHIVTVTYTDGTTDRTEIINTTMETANAPYFYGFKANDGEYIKNIVISANNIMYFDDVCVILEDTSVDYTDLEYATEMLKIYGDNFTEYVPLDAFGAQQDANTNRVKISWASSDPTVVTTDGKVYPVVGVEKKVKLTATLKDINTQETATKEFTVTIPAVSEYVIEGVKLTGADGLIDTQLVAGKTIEKVSVKRYENSRSNITVVTALYDGQKNLADVKIETVTPAIEPQAHGDITLTDPLTLPADITGYTAKIMLLSSKNELVPLCESYTVNPMSNDITVFMVGDSLTADYTDSKYPRTGWGSCVGTYIDNVEVDNIAVSGMSTKTFMSNGTKLPYLEENVKEGDYIFLMYGHNDQKIKSIEDDVTENGIKTKKWVNQHSGIGTYGTVEGDTFSYFGYISNIVKVAREKKANIVFFTQFARATNGLEGLLGYPAALTAFANAQNLPVIDTTTPSLALYDKLLEKGEDLVEEGTATDAVSFANNIFLHLTKEDPRYINDPRFKDSDYYTKADKEDDPVNGIDRKDNTHFNLYGAQVRARLAVLGLIDADNALARFEKVNDTDFDALCSNVINEILATDYYGKK